MAPPLLGDLSGKLQGLTLTEGLSEGSECS